MIEAELLERIARMLKDQVGPAVDDAFPKTQAFMASVVLQKLARQLASAPEHAVVKADDLDALAGDLETALAGVPVPDRVAAALAGLRNRPEDAALCRLIEALYAARGDLGDARFDAALGRVRRTLRADLDRRMTYAS